MGSRHASTIAFIGIDGSGKSTLAAAVGDWLNAEGVTANLHKFRTGRSGLERFARDAGFAHPGAFAGWDSAMLMMGALAWQSGKDAKSLRRLSGSYLLFDRYSWCLYALARMHAPAIEPKLRLLLGTIPPPELTVFVAVKPRVAQERLAARGGSPKSFEFLSAFDAAYRALPEFPRFAKIDGNKSPHEMLDEAKQLIGAHADWVASEI